MDFPPSPQNWTPEPEDPYILDTVRSCGTRARLTRANWPAEKLADVAVQLWESLIYMGQMEMNDLIKSVGGPRRASLRMLYQMRDLRLVQTRTEIVDSHFIFSWWATPDDFARRVRHLATQTADAMEKRIEHESAGIFGCGEHPPLSHDDAMDAKFRCFCGESQSPQDTAVNSLQGMVAELRS